MSGLVEFLTARLDEDMEYAERFACDDDHGGLIPNPGCRARVLREVEAKRRIVTECGWVTVMRLLASVYADHPSFREEWRV